MSRPIIHCPHCHRELYNLHRPQCLWCGACIAEDEFQQVALPLGAPQAPLPQPVPMTPPMTGMSWSGRGWGLFEGNPFLLIKRSVSPWERKLRIVGAALFVCVGLVHFAHGLYSMWVMQHLMSLVHHSWPPAH